MVYILQAAGGGNPARFACPFLGLHGPDFGFLALPMSKDIAPAQTRAFTARFWPNEKKGLAIRPALVYDLHQESKIPPKFSPFGGFDGG